MLSPCGCGSVLVLLDATGHGAALGMCACLFLACSGVLVTLPLHISAVNQLLLSLGFAADATAGMCIPAGLLVPLLDLLHPFPEMVVESVSG